MTPLPVPPSIRRPTVSSTVEGPASPVVLSVTIDLASCGSPSVPRAVHATAGHVRGTGSADSVQLALNLPNGRFVEQPRVARPTLGLDPSRFDDVGHDVEGYVHTAGDLGDGQ